MFFLRYCANIYILLYIYSFKRSYFLCKEKQAITEGKSAQSTEPNTYPLIVTPCCVNFKAVVSVVKCHSPEIFRVNKANGPTKGRLFFMRAIYKGGRKLCRLFLCFMILFPLAELTLPQLTQWAFSWVSCKSKQAFSH